MIDTLLQQAADLLFALWPRSFPGIDRLKRCKIVSHRGVFDNRTVYENTLAAFKKVRDYGIWGTELDIRWTKDLHPVISHDPATERVFHENCAIADLTLTQVKERFPLIPTLGETIAGYGKTLHLMIEIKKEAYPDPSAQNQILRDLLSPLSPEIDYHLLSLHPEMFEVLDFTAAHTCLPIAEHNVSQLSDLAVEKHYGGITGHFLLIDNRYLKKHRLNKQKVGTGFISSKNCLYRELNRGVEWIFSNHAVKLQTIVNGALKNQRPTAGLGV